MHSAIFQKAVGSRGSACERPRCGKQRVGAGAVVGDWQGESRSQSRVPQEESPLSSSAEDEIFPFKERRRGVKRPSGTFYGGEPSQHNAVRCAWGSPMRRIRILRLCIWLFAKKFFDTLRPIRHDAGWAFVTCYFDKLDMATLSEASRRRRREVGAMVDRSALRCPR
mgnify:CR=1 FL=1